MSRVRAPSVAHFLAVILTIIKAIILGLIQGVGEFFPISSSTHLWLARSLLDIDSPHSFFDISCHFGTSFALLFFFRKDIQRILKDRKELSLYFIALLPLVPAYLLFRHIATPIWLGVIFTSFLLFLAFYSKEKDPLPRNKFRDVLFIGLMQGAALMPGISRAGSTISAACFRGWDMERAIRFSFLLSIPTVMGGTLLELVKGEVDLTLDWKFHLVGFFVSLVTALFVVRILLHITKRHLLFFALYMGCLALWVISR